MCIQNITNIFVGFWIRTSWVLRENQLMHRKYYHVYSISSKVWQVHRTVVGLALVTTVVLTVLRSRTSLAQEIAVLANFWKEKKNVWMLEITWETAGAKTWLSHAKNQVWIRLEWTPDWTIQVGTPLKINIKLFYVTWICHMTLSSNMINLFDYLYHKLLCKLVNKGTNIDQMNKTFKKLKYGTLSIWLPAHLRELQWVNNLIWYKEQTGENWSGCKEQSLFRLLLRKQEIESQWALEVMISEIYWVKRWIKFRLMIYEIWTLPTSAKTCIISDENIHIYVCKSFGLFHHLTKTDTM